MLLAVAGGSLEVRVLGPTQLSRAGAPVELPRHSERAFAVPPLRAGTYTIRTEYFDTLDGTSRFELFLNDQRIDTWTASDRLPTHKLDGTSSVRRSTPGIPLRPGDRVRIVGRPDSGERAAFDYVEITSQRASRSAGVAGSRWWPGMAGSSTAPFRKRSAATNRAASRSRKRRASAA